MMVGSIMPSSDQVIMHLHSCICLLFVICYVRDYDGVVTGETIVDRGRGTLVGLVELSKFKTFICYVICLLVKL